MRNAVYLLLYLSFASFVALSAGAYSLAHAVDLDWLYRAANCDQLSLGITKHFARQSSGNMTPEGRAELRVVLFEGCGPRFVGCNLSVCDQAALLEAAEPRPLDWINSVTSCGEFKTEFKKRYSFLRSFEGLDPHLQIELDYIFHRVCAENFEDCAFSQCNRDIGGAVAAVPSATTIEKNSVPSPFPSEGDRNAFDSQVAAEVMNAVAVRSKLQQAKEPPIPSNDRQGESSTIGGIPPMQGKGSDLKPTVESDATTASSETELEFRSRMLEYDRIVAEGLLERAAAVEMQMTTEKERDVQWVTAANPDELETLRRRREQEATERRSPVNSRGVNPRTGVAPEARPPRNTPHYQGTTPQRRPAPIKPRIKIQDSGGPLTY